MSQTSLRKASEAFFCVCGRSLRQWNHQSTMPVIRAMQGTAASLAIDVVVPSMGDSITEGSISTVMKVANDAVDEDEAIVQIETDKVTIDVRAPLRGMVRAMLVKEEDVVVVGQVVAVLDEADAPSVSTSAAPFMPAPSPSAPKQSLEELTDAASRISDSALRGAKARIQFPPRRTDTGMVISFMPACDQKTYTAREIAAKTAQVSSQSNPVASGGLKARADTTCLRAQVPRRVVAELEMESIMLGGAPP